MEAGQRLRALREQLGLSIREVETCSLRIAEKHGQNALAIPVSRLFDIENKGVVPSSYRFYSLSVIYRRDLRELLSWYGVNVNAAAEDMRLLDLEMPVTHLATCANLVTTVEMPVSPGFDPTQTRSLGPLVEQWGTVSLASLRQLASHNYSYAYIGTEDFTMYPLLPPGSFVQIDQSRNKVVEGEWRSEYERPIYLVETRDGFACCWCSLSISHIVLQPHPLSAAPVRILRYPQEADVVGEVVGMALRRGTKRDPSA